MEMIQQVHTSLHEKVQNEFTNNNNNNNNNKTTLYDTR